MFGITAGGNTAIYWDLNGHDETTTLVDVCNSGVHSFVILSNASLFGGATGHTPTLNNLTGHLGVSSDEIEACQSLDVKILVALTDGGNFSVTDYIWDNFLGGSSSSRPFGHAVLDGINFDIDEIDDAATMRYEELANSLSQLSSGQGRKLYLTATSVMPYPGALKVANLVDGVQVGLPHNLDGRALYMYVQTTNNGKEDAGLLGTQLEKGY
ncbi:hypothetical protein QOZ80_1BG0077500 [Eleusine coracana subsp. coracana]|nr:hypothetical protein QOZ80_1BG0077500 [Eleusine coracana subsp. coracana]